MRRINLCVCFQCSVVFQFILPHAMVFFVNVLYIRLYLSFMLLSSRREPVVSGVIQVSVLYCSTIQTEYNHEVQFR